MRHICECCSVEAHSPQGFILGGVCVMCELMSCGPPSLRFLHIPRMMFYGANEVVGAIRLRAMYGNTFPCKHDPTYQCSERGSPDSADGWDDIFFSVDTVRPSQCPPSPDLYDCTSPFPLRSHWQTWRAC